MSPRAATGGRAASQSGRALSGLRDLVFSGAYLPGERLSEVELAARLKLSRTPVRSALARMGQEGLLEEIPSGGWTVRAFAPADVADAIELRGVLEGTAARLAAERGVDPARLGEAAAQLAGIDALLAPGVETADVEAYRGANAAFHACLAALSGSRILVAEIERAARLPFAEPSAFLTAQAGIPDLRASLAVGQSQHRAILEAIEGRQGARAEALAREHARLARRNLDAVLTDRNLVDKVPGLRLLGR
ncbi:GntR family transcriptional regulator [uncultured Albimonas sp.]|uniref:GntR family transcriptional regulator n=1 Tax=uncultured Albimonas sp. TaxID=1331701 RepID=UPI0030EBFA0B